MDLNKPGHKSQKSFLSDVSNASMSKRRKGTINNGLVFQDTNEVVYMRDIDFMGSDAEE